MSKSQPYIGKFRTQRDQAQRRGIAFKFTYEDWVAWWEEKLGPDWERLRGCKRGQFVMARFGDRGSYERHNVRAIRAEENIRLYNKQRKKIKGYSFQYLSDEIVKAIYLDKSPYKEIARKYEVTTHKIQCIKQKHYYRKITDALDLVNYPRK